ncbi:MAG: arylesterase [Spongiibacter sp.]|nr:arylesterase [Spongiibacter sp.]
MSTRIMLISAFPIRLVSAFFCALLFSLGAAATERHLLVLGDSISAGYGMSENESWPSLLTEQLPKHYRLTNASVSGETTAGALRRLPGLLAENRFDIVIIELGGNDGLRGYPVAGIRKNLATLIRQSQQHGANVVLMSMKIPPNYGRRYTAAFEAMYAALAEEHQIPLLPFILDDIATNPQLMQADGIHPNAQAQPLIVTKVLTGLEGLLN